MNSSYFNVKSPIIEHTLADVSHDYNCCDEIFYDMADDRRLALTTIRRNSTVNDLATLSGDSLRNFSLLKRELSTLEDLAKVCESSADVLCSTRNEDSQWDVRATGMKRQISNQSICNRKEKRMRKTESFSNVSLESVIRGFLSVTEGKLQWPEIKVDTVVEPIIYKAFGSDESTLCDEYYCADHTEFDQTALNNTRMNKSSIEHVAKESAIAARRYSI